MKLFWQTPVRYNKERGRLLDADSVIIADYNLYGEDSVIDTIGCQLEYVLNNHADLTAQVERLTKALDAAEAARLKAELSEVDEPYFGWCNVEGCEMEGSSGGMAWRDTGYWTVCWKHGQAARDGLPQPKMQQEAIDREATRDTTTGFLPARQTIEAVAKIRSGE